MVTFAPVETPYTGLSLMPQDISGLCIKNAMPQDIFGFMNDCYYCIRFNLIAL